MGGAGQQGAEDRFVAQTGRQLGRGYKDQLEIGNPGDQFIDMGRGIGSTVIDLEDVIVEPVRSILIPVFEEVKLKCKEAGALGGGISGSGPSIFMLSKDETTATEVEIIMKEIYEKIDVDYKTYVTGVNSDGVKILES